MINLQITYANAEVKEVTAGASEIVAFETKFDLSIARLEKDFRLTHLFFLAWSAENNSGSTKEDFDTWLKKIKNVEPSEQKK